MRPDHPSDGGKGRLTNVNSHGHGVRPLSTNKYGPFVEVSARLPEANISNLFILRFCASWLDGKQPPARHLNKP